MAIPLRTTDFPDDGSTSGSGRRHARSGTAFVDSAAPCARNHRPAVRAQYPGETAIASLRSPEWTSTFHDVLCEPTEGSSDKRCRCFNGASDLLSAVGGGSASIRQQEPDATGADSWSMSTRRSGAGPRHRAAQALIVVPDRRTSARRRVRWSTSNASAANVIAIASCPTLGVSIRRTRAVARGGCREAGSVLSHALESFTARPTAGKAPSARRCSRLTGREPISDVWALDALRIWPIGLRATPRSAPARAGFCVGLLRGHRSHRCCAPAPRVAYPGPARSSTTSQLDTRPIMPWCRTEPR